MWYTPHLTALTRFVVRRVVVWRSQSDLVCELHHA